MANKNLTLILVGADRQLWAGEGARLQITDVTHGDLDVLFDKRLDAGSHTILFNLDLHFEAGQVYGISVDAKKHRTAWQLINRRTFLQQSGGAEVEVKDRIMQLMLVPRKTRSSDLDAAYRRLLDRGSPVVAESTGVSEAAYLDLKDAARMALLNIEAKLRNTRLGGVPLLSFLEGVRFVEVDRLFLYMRSELKHLVEEAGEFASAPGHGEPEGTPIALPAHPDSWKHRRFGAGNLQLSFSKNSEPMPGKPGTQVFSVDADIDLETGLLHVFEYLDNKLLHPDQKTDQAQVYALLFSQGIAPDYTLNPLAD
jgi:hypothetical protein